MPELPEVQALCELLDSRTRGLEITRCDLVSFAALKTYDPPLDSLVGLQVRGCERRGKHVCFHLDDRWMVIHLARGGWIKWLEMVPPGSLKSRRSPLALRVVYGDGSGMDVTEMGTEKRLAIWVVHRPEDVESIAALGPDALDPSLDVEKLGKLLGAETGTVKNALSRQSVVAGIGNAYSDEILHAARISPFKPASGLDEEDLARLQVSIREVLGEAVSRAEGLEASELKGDKKQSMRVHGRTGEPCPVCGDRVREVAYANRSLQYCPTCQTGGRVLADRRLSRLIK